MEIIPAIHEGLELWVEDKIPKTGVYYPSSIFSCLRKSYYDYTSPMPHNLDTLKIFGQGIAYHNIVQKALTFYAKKHPEIKIQNEPEDVERIYKGKKDGIELHGRMDCFLKTKKGITIIEIKSINGLNYAPKEEHISQLNYYLHFYPDAEGILLYMNKARKDGDFYEDFREFKYGYDEGLFNMLLKRALSLHEHLTKKELPMPEAYMRGGTTDWECGRQNTGGCPHKLKCFTEIWNSHMDKIINDPEELNRIKEILGADI